MDWSTALVLWTPLSIGLLAVFLLVAIVIAMLLWTNRATVATWLRARLSESSTRHGLTVAGSATSLWLASGGAMPIQPVLIAWAGALVLFVWPSASANPPPAGP